METELAMVFEHLSTAGLRIQDSFRVLPSPYLRSNSRESKSIVTYDSLRGTTTTDNNSNAVLVKYDSSGKVLWARTITASPE
jgi:hypothetical protein